LPLIGLIEILVIPRPLPKMAAKPQKKHDDHRVFSRGKCHGAHRLTGEGSCDKNDCELPELQIDIEPVYPVILRILGSLAAHLVGKYIMPGSLAPPIS